YLLYTSLTVNIHCISFFFSTAAATSQIYTLSLHDALPIYTLSRSNRHVTIETINDPSNQILERMSTMTKVTIRSTDLEVNPVGRSEEHTSELQSRFDLVCRLLLEKKNKNNT